MSWRPTAYAAVDTRASSPAKPPAYRSWIALSREANSRPPAGPWIRIDRSSGVAELTALRAPASTTSRL
ncbi:hypothetical protein [Phytohabitans suffuscus]|uniref:hypothetical protein n=1 Tax=Phytohabitans suffuscus TaxID=624315 RepID=UPI001E391EF7|nr:hypothetical protein [Phytohabitans suffuscus]